MAHLENRNYGIDAFRFVAAFCIVVVHSGYFDSLPSFIGIELRLLSRWAVPFFFIVSGYFLAKNLKSDDGKFEMQILRLFIILILASIIMMPLIIYQNGLVYTAKHLLSMRIFLGEAYFHLWFLSAQAITITVIYLLNKLRLNKLFSIILILALIIIIADSYFPKIKPLYELSRQMSAFVFIYIGFYIKVKNISINKKISFYLILSGILIQSIESYLLHEYLGKNAYFHEVLLGTFPYALGMFYLSKEIVSSSSVKYFAANGVKYALGIYIIHPYFIFLFKELAIDYNMKANFMYDLCLVPLAFLSSWLFLSVLFKLLPFVEAFLNAEPSLLKKLNKIIPIPDPIEFSKK